MSTWASEKKLCSSNFFWRKLFWRKLFFFVFGDHMDEFDPAVLDAKVLIANMRQHLPCSTYFKVMAILGSIREKNIDDSHLIPEALGIRALVAENKLISKMYTDYVERHFPIASFAFWTDSGQPIWHHATLDDV